jgi:hypothetical protein
MWIVVATMKSLSLTGGIISSCRPAMMDGRGGDIRGSSKGYENKGGEKRGVSEL